MKYLLDSLNHCDFKIMEKGRLAPRAYFIPFESKKALQKTDYKNERFSSDTVTVLSGEWDFKYYKKKSKLPETLDTAKVNFDSVSVPSTWQRTGYEEPVYLNCPYGFDPRALGGEFRKGVTPPVLPDDFSCGIYRKKINITDMSRDYIITFLGVSPCLDLYCNGKFVGYGECSHNSYEFDLTKYLCEGENEILAVVFKWANSTYLEAQDMFRENGIFRDVLLTANKKTYVFDYEAIPEKKGKKYDLAVKTTLKGAADGCFIKAELFDGKTKLCEELLPAEAENSIAFKKLDVSEWSAEILKLYELYITLYNGKKESEVIRSYVGFKDIRIDGTTFLFNGKKIKLKGVNHHDTHETRGYAMNYADLEKDVSLMKQFNVNCVRTSHYPPDPHFLELCDHYGLYVVDEADIETHGLWSLCEDETMISHDLKWAGRYMDRVKRMYYRDRNKASIIMWSLGNESKGYKCHDKCYDMLKNQIGTKIPVHYEGVSGTKRRHYDVMSEMYTHPDDLIKVRERKRAKYYTEVPFYLCEYAHAMGVGPGALEDYFRIFNSDDIFMGGCIWEWADHSVLHDGTDKYKYQYTYGGDHGEKLHDGNFCVDGLFYPDRTPHTGAYEMKAVYRPLRVRKLSGNALTVVNTNRFRSSSYIEIYWELQEDGETTVCGSFSTDIAPEKEATYKLDLPKYAKDKNVYLNIIYLDGDFEIASEQLEIQKAGFNFPVLESGKATVSSDSEKITVKFEDGSMEFSEETGEMLSYKKDGVNVLSKAPVSHKGFLLNLSRAYTDNDRTVVEGWREHNLYNPKIVLEDLSAEVKSGIASVSEYLSVYGSKDVLFNASVLYIIGANGNIDIEVSIIPAEDTTEKAENIPCVGLTFEADKKYSEIEYFGRGDKECLSDFKVQSPVGLYKAQVSDEHEPYIRPQDNMNHCDTSYLKLISDDSEILIYSDKEFDFSVHNYTKELLEKADHREDVYDQKTTFVTLNGYTRGIGTGSCGPVTLPEYAVDSENELDFNFVIVPIKKK